MIKQGFGIEMVFLDCIDEIGFFLDRTASFGIAVTNRFFLSNRYFWIAVVQSSFLVSNRYFWDRSNQQVVFGTKPVFLGLQ